MREGLQWFHEAKCDCYVEMLATVFGVPHAKVLVDVERVRACHAAADLIEGVWS